MFNTILLVIVIVVGSYFRFKYDKKYVIPVIKENKDLSSCYKWVIGAFAVAMGCFIFNQKNIGFVVLLLIIPFVLYLNSKVNGIAWKNYKNDRK